MLMAGQWSPLSGDRRSATAFDFKPNKPYPKNVWEGFALRPGIPITCIVIVCGFCAAFLKMMEKIPKTVLFGTFVLEWVLALTLACLLTFPPDDPPASDSRGGSEDSELDDPCGGRRRLTGVSETGAKLAVPLWLAVVFIPVWVGWMRERIEKAAAIVSAAANALLNMPSLMACVFGWLFVSAALIVIKILVLAAAGQVSEIVEKTSYGVVTQCDFEQSKWAQNSIPIVFALWKWMWFYANALLVFFIAGSVGTYHFNRESVTRALPLKFIRIGLTTSIGTVALLALVFQVIDYIRRKSRATLKNICCKCGWANPLTWIACLVRCCCLTFLNMVTKFCLVFHVFTGEPFWESAKRTKALLERAGLHGQVLETTLMNSAVFLFTIISYFLSLGTGIFCWFWMGVEYKDDVLCGGDGGEALKVCMLILFFILMLMPTSAIVLIVLIAFIAGNNIVSVWIPWCCGIFVGAVTAFFFQQTVLALLYAANTMFVAIAIDEATGRQGDPNDKLYTCVIGEIQEAKSIAAAGVPQGPAVQGIELPPLAQPPPPQQFVQQQQFAQPTPQYIMDVMLPHGCTPGQQMQIQTPHGSLITITAPADCTPGQTIQVQY